jgi:hypothetical protein
MGMLDSFLNPDKPYKEAQKAANAGYAESQNYLSPFMNQGASQFQRLNDATGQLLNPEELQNKWASGYQTSPYAQREMQILNQLGPEEASRLGISGSSALFNNQQQGAGDIVSKDRQSYLNDLMQKYMTGIGLGQNLYGVGANAGNVLGQNALSHGNDIAGLKYNEEAAPGRMLGSILGGVANVGANMLLPGSGNAASQFFKFN